MHAAYPPRPYDASGAPRPSVVDVKRPCLDGIASPAPAPAPALALAPAHASGFVRFKPYGPARSHPARPRATLIFKAIQSIAVTSGYDIVLAKAVHDDPAPEERLVAIKIATGRTPSARERVGCAGGNEKTDQGAQIIILDVHSHAVGDNDMDPSRGDATEGHDIGSKKRKRRSDGRGAKGESSHDAKKGKKKRKKEREKRKVKKKKRTQTKDSRNEGKKGEAHEGPDSKGREEARHREGHEKEKEQKEEKEEDGKDQDRDNETRGNRKRKDRGQPREGTNAEGEKEERKRKRGRNARERKGEDKETNADSRGADNGHRAPGQATERVPPVGGKQTHLGNGDDLGDSAEGCDRDKVHLAAGLAVSFRSLAHAKAQAALPKEARVMRELDHPHIVKAIAFSDDLGHMPCVGDEIRFETRAEAGAEAPRGCMTGCAQRLATGVCGVGEEGMGKSRRHVLDRGMGRDDSPSPSPSTPTPGSGGTFATALVATASSSGSYLTPSASRNPSMSSSPSLSSALPSESESELESEAGSASSVAVGSRRGSVRTVGGGDAAADARSGADAHGSGRSDGATRTPTVEPAVRMPAIVTTWRSGGDLITRMKSKGTMNEAEARELMRQIASALCHAHSRGVVHRDVKPDNVFVDEKGDYLLGDWGMAGHWRSGHRKQRACGTPGYVAYEICRREPYVGPEVDWFSLGATLYAMLHGRFATGKPGSALSKYCTENRICKPCDEWVSPGMRAAIEGLMHAEPLKRWGSFEVSRFLRECDPAIPLRGLTVAGADRPCERRDYGGEKRPQGAGAGGPRPSHPVAPAPGRGYKKPYLPRKRNPLAIDPKAWARFIQQRGRGAAEIEWPIAMGEKTDAPGATEDGHAARPLDGSISSTSDCATGPASNSSSEQGSESMPVFGLGFNSSLSHQAGPTPSPSRSPPRSVGHHPVGAIPGATMTTTLAPPAGPSPWSPLRRARPPTAYGDGSPFASEAVGVTHAPQRVVGGCAGLGKHHDGPSKEGGEPVDALRSNKRRRRAREDVEGREGSGLRGGCGDRDDGRRAHGPSGWGRVSSRDSERCGSAGEHSGDPVSADLAMAGAWPTGIRSPSRGVSSRQRKGRCSPLVSMFEGCDIVPETPEGRRESREEAMDEDGDEREKRARYGTFEAGAESLNGKMVRGSSSGRADAGRDGDGKAKPENQPRSPKKKRRRGCFW